MSFEGSATDTKHLLLGCVGLLCKLNWKVAYDVHLPYLKVSWDNFDVTTPSLQFD